MLLARRAAPVRAFPVARIPVSFLLTCPFLDLVRLSRPSPRPAARLLMSGFIFSHFLGLLGFLHCDAWWTGFLLRVSIPHSVPVVSLILTPFPLTVWSLPPFFSSPRRTVCTIRISSPYSSHCPLTLIGVPPPPHDTPCPLHTVRSFLVFHAAPLFFSTMEGASLSLCCASGRQVF